MNVIEDRREITKRVAYEVKYKILICLIKYAISSGDIYANICIEGVLIKIIVIVIRISLRMQTYGNKLISKKNKVGYVKGQGCG